MKPETTQVNEKKVGIVKEFSDLLKNKKTILIASIKNLPASQFQEICKQLRGKAIVKVPKKNLILRAIEESKNDDLKKIKEYIKGSTAILFSDLDSFELAADLIENKSPSKAKIGQKAPEDIEVQAGPTELLPGPAITELGSLGIQIQIEKGKISIKEPKIIVKEGQKISENAASVMNKLDIKPFSVGFIPLMAFDTKEKTLYLEIKIDKEETLRQLKESFSKSLAFAVEMNYVSEDTIKLLIGKASRNEKAIDNLLNKEPEKEETKEEEKTEEKKEDEEESNEKTEKDNIQTPEENLGEEKK